MGGQRDIKMEFDNEIDLSDLKMLLELKGKWPALYSLHLYGLASGCKKIRISFVEHDDEAGMLVVLNDFLETMKKKGLLLTAIDFAGLESCADIDVLKKNKVKVVLLTQEDFVNLEEYADVVKTKLTNLPKDKLGKICSFNIERLKEIDEADSEIVYVRAAVAKARAEISRKK